MELEKLGGEFLEVVGVGEEGEDDLDGPGEGLRGLKNPDLPEFGVAFGLHGDCFVLACGHWLCVFEAWFGADAEMKVQSEKKLSAAA